MIVKFDNQYNGKWTMQIFENESATRPIIGFQQPKAKALAAFAAEIAEFAETGQPVVLEVEEPAPAKKSKKSKKAAASA